MNRNSTIYFFMYYFDGLLFDFIALQIDSKLNLYKKYNIKFFLFFFF